MRHLPALLAISVLTGCATSAAGLHEAHVRAVYDSTKTSQQFATCVAETLIGNPQMRNDGDHYWVLRMNGYGIPVVRWDFTPRPEGGSHAELRASIPVSVGTGRVQACL